MDAIDVNGFVIPLPDDETLIESLSDLHASAL